jgi:Na+/H+ antiporter NhaD/arsenite permease-like protein
MASCSAAIIVAVVLMIMGVWEDQAFTRNMLSESIAATLVFFTSAFWFKKDDPRHRELLAFEEDMRRPVIAESAPMEAGDLRVYRLLGQVCLVLGVVLGVCVLVPGSPVAPSLINVIAGVFLLILGAFVYHKTREQRR